MDLQALERIFKPALSVLQPHIQGGDGYDRDISRLQVFPVNWKEFILFPFVFNLDPYHVNEVKFFDLRFPIWYVLSLVAFIAMAARHFIKNSKIATAMSGKERFLCAFMVIGYFLWVFLFSVYRYIMVLEMLAPVVIYILVKRIFAGEVKRFLVTGILFIIILSTMQIGRWERVKWGDDYFGVVPPRIEEPENSIVLMAGHDAYSYLVPFFPKGVRFVRIQSWLTGPSSEPNGFDRLMQDIIKKHQGAIYVLYKDRESERKMTIESLDAYGLRVVDGQCQSMKPHIETYNQEQILFCEVRKR